MSISKGKESSIAEHAELLYTRAHRNLILAVDGLLLLKRIYSLFRLWTNSRLPGALKRFEDKSWGMTRTEIVCARCGGHLVRSRLLLRLTFVQGHIFKGEGFRKENGDKIDERHCVNSISLKFSDQKDAKDATK